MKILKVYDSHRKMMHEFDNFVAYNSATIDKVFYKTLSVVFKSGITVNFQLLGSNLGGMEFEFIDIDSGSHFNPTELAYVQSRVRVGSKPLQQKVIKRTTTVEEFFE